MNWNRLQKYYEELAGDVYEQPDEQGRIDVSRNVIASAPVAGLKSVLDVGCGYGYAQSLFPEMEYFGITSSSKENDEAKKLGRRVVLMDYNNIEFSLEFDLIFSSHSLEHSPFPLMTLMEWHRVGKNLLLIVPNPRHYGYIGRNHYSVSEPQQVRWWLRRAGWKVTWNMITNTDLAFFATREPRVGSEGWAELDPKIYEADRDNTI